MSEQIEVAYIIEIKIGPDEWKRVGKWYRRKEVARSWLSFVKAAWHAKHARVAEVKRNES